MKNFLKNIAVGFLIVIMMVSSLGFSVNTLYCYCMGQYEVSLFDIEHHCNKKHSNGDENDDFIKTLPPCCQKAMAKAKKAETQDDCTKQGKKYFKADLKFLAFQKTELPQPLFVIIEKCFLNNFTFAFSEIRNPKSEIPTRPPPQYYGRFLLNFIQVYRC